MAATAGMHSPAVPLEADDRRLSHGACGAVGVSGCSQKKSEPPVVNNRSSLHSWYPPLAKPRGTVGRPPIAINDALASASHLPTAVG